MHLVEQYALSCGVKIDKPHVETSFFPLPFEKYIILHASSGMPSKNYDFFEDVVEVILPHLESQNIKIIQIGGSRDMPIGNCHHLQGKTSLHQTFYLIKNCMALLGNDSFSTHVASGFDKKIVSLYGNSPKECCGPYWGKKENQSSIQAKLNSPKHSFSPNENKKSVNNICSWEVASSLLNLLGLKDDEALNLETIYHGHSYWNKSVEVIPNFYSEKQPEGFPPSVNLRLDYRESVTDVGFFIDRSLEWMQNRPTHLIFKDQIDLNIFRPFFKNLAKISFCISPSTNENYIKLLKKSGKPTSFFCDNPDQIDEVQLKFLDSKVTLSPQGLKKDLDFDISLCDNAFYKTSKVLLSQNKMYSSRASYLKNIEYSNRELIIDSPEFWKEIQHYKLYRNKNAKN
jgi:hypothetical protein